MLMLFLASSMVSAFGYRSSSSSSSCSAPLCCVVLFLPSCQYCWLDSQVATLQQEPREKPERDGRRTHCFCRSQKDQTSQERTPVELLQEVEDDDEDQERDDATNAHESDLTKEIVETIVLLHCCFHFHLRFLDWDCCWTKKKQMRMKKRK